MTTLREKLTKKRAGYQQSLAQAEHRIVQLRENLRAARVALREAEQLRAGLQTGLQVVDETLMDLAAEGRADG